MYSDRDKYRMTREQGVGLPDLLMAAQLDPLRAWLACAYPSPRARERKMNESISPPKWPVTRR